MKSANTAIITDNSRLLAQLDALLVLHTITGSVAIAISYAALALATFHLTQSGGGAVLLLIVGAANLMSFRFARTTEGRVGAMIFAAAMIVRGLAAVIFQRQSLVRGPFLGSPDAWNFHTWAARLTMLMRSGSAPSLPALWVVGRSDVAYYYVLAAFYYVFGISVFIGRLVGAVSGALAALMLFLLARRIVAFPYAALAGLTYALWPASIGWSCETILRDAFVWFLLLAAALTAARVVERGRFRDAALLCVVLFALRCTRPYGSFLLYMGMGLCLILALRQTTRDRKLLKRAAVVLSSIVVIEIVVTILGFPNVFSTIRLYNIGHWIFRPLPTVEVQLPPSTSSGPANPDHAPSGAVPQGAIPTAVPPTPPPTTSIQEPGAERSTTSPPAEMPAGVSPSTAPAPEIPPAPIAIDTKAAEAMARPQTSSMPGNVVRLILGPFGWTFFLPGHSTWAVYSVWLWYVLIPLAAVGVVPLLRRGSTLPRAIVIVTALYLGLLLVIGRGDAYRQREMAVPFLILIAVAGVLMMRERRKILVRTYIAWTLLVILALVYHVHSLKGRNFAVRGDLPGAAVHVAHQSRPSDHNA